MQFKDTVRIRKDRSTESDRIATGYKNELVKVIENYSDGWSKIEYNGVVGHCMTEFLTSTEGVPMLSIEEVQEEENETPAEETAQEESTATEVNKRMQFKETVRIRAERSTDSERIGTGYTSELVKVLENYSDGWSKIEYNGVTGYCKTEFLEEAR